MRFQLCARFCPPMVSLCALMTLSGCGQQANSIGLPTSGIGTSASSTATKETQAVNGKNKAVADKGKAAKPAPAAKKATPKPVRLPSLINIGSRRQLFVDDYLLESFRNTKRVLNPAEKSDGNPILRADKPWEGREVVVEAVIYEEQEKLFRMWYGSKAGMCLATSKDGVNWQKPILRRVKYKGSLENNILPPAQVKTYFFKDLHEKDPAKRYKGLERIGSMSTTMHFNLFYSPDGFNWTPYKKNPVINTAPRKGRWGPTVFMGWDPIRKVYAVHMENSLHRWSPAGRRIIGRAESPDMIHWTQAETIIIPDKKDPPDMDFYCMPVMAYEDQYVGLLWTFRTIRTTIVPQIVFSRDGIHYNRSYRQPFIRRGAKGNFDAAVVYPVPPIVHGDRILFYYTGGNYRDNTTRRALGNKATFAVGLATTPRDRFVSFEGVRFSDEAGYKPYSEVVTRTFSFSGKKLYLNLQANLYTGAGVSGPCGMWVEILDTTHQPIPGFTMRECDPIHRGGLDLAVSWKGRHDLSKLAGRPLKLKFHFRNASFYAFQFK